MKKNLRSKILLCVLAGGVLAANTALAAEYTKYTEAILGAEDTGNIYNSIKSNTGNNYTYTFTEDSVIKINGDEYGIAIGEDNTYNTVNTDSITVAGANLNIDIVNEQLNTTADGYGISVGAGKDDKTIDMSKNDGIIRVSTVSSTNWRATSRGAVLHDSGSNKNNTIHIGNAIMELSAYNNAAGNASIAGIYITAGTEHTITMGDGQITGKAVSENGLAEAWGVYDGGTDTNVKLENVLIDILAEGNADFIVASGIEKYNAGNVEVGDGDIVVKAINNSVVADTESLAKGIYADTGSVVTKENGKIDVFAEGGKYTTAYGVYAYGSTVNLNGIVDINAEAVDSGNNTPSAYGIYAEGNDAEVNMQGGSITAQINNADGVTDNNNNDSYAIYGYDSSVININQGTTNKVVINGDIRTGRNAAVNLNLNTADSVLTGSIEDDDGTLNLANDASWIATGYSEVNKLTMNQGNIYVETPSNIGDITINEYSGVGNIIFKADNTDEDGIVNINTSSFIISDAIEDSYINVGVSNASINTLDFNKAEESLNTLAGKVYYDGDKNNLNGKVIIKEGLITPEASGDLLFYEDNANGHTAGQGYVANVKKIAVQQRLITLKTSPQLPLLLGGRRTAH